MSQDFEDHCWRDVIDQETLDIYKDYARDVFVGPRPAVLMVDVYKESYEGGARPVSEVVKDVNESFTLITFDQGAGFVYILSYILFAASFGFFVFNFPVAKIFMGDVGSQFLGFVFATIAVLATEFEGARLSFLIMPLLFFHFIFDTVFTFFRRLLAGENVTQAHRSHLYQLMNRLGYSHAQVSIFNFGVSLAQCVGAVVLTRSALAEPGLVLVPFLVFEIINAVFVVRAARRKALI